MSYTVPEASKKNWLPLLQATFDQIWDDMQAAGSGTPGVRVGTYADMLAYGAPYSGLGWLCTDEDSLYKYSTTISDWVLVGTKISSLLVDFLAAASLADARAELEVYSQDEVDDLVQAVAAQVVATGFSRVINGGAMIAQQPAANAANSYTHGTVDFFKVKADFTTVSAGTLEQAAGADSDSGYWLKAAGLTASGGNQQVLAGTVIPAGRCKDLVSQTVALKVAVKHDVGSAKNVSVKLYSADAEDNFGAVTLVGTVVAATSVADSTVVELEGTINAGANAGNGLMIEIVFDVAADVATKNFYVSDLTLVKGGNAQDYAANQVEELRACREFYLKYCGCLAGLTLSATEILISVPAQMYSAPSLVLLDTAPTLIQVSGGSATGSSSTITAGSANKNGAFLKVDGFTGLGASAVVLYDTDSFLALSARLW